MIAKRWISGLVLCALAVGAVGCSSEQPRKMSVMLSASTAPPATQATSAMLPLTTPTAVVRPVVYQDSELQAICMPPAGWVDKGMKQGDNHVRRTWVDPTNTMGYCVIRASLPLPVGESMVLSAFLAEVRKTQGDARLIEKRSSGEGLTFVAESPILRYEGRVHCSGFRGWIVFASILNTDSAHPENLKVAEAARDATILGQ